MTAEQALQPQDIDLQPVESLRAFRQRQGAEYIRKAAAVVKTAFEVASDTGNPTYLLYSGLLARPAFTAGNMKLAAVAMQSLGRVIRQQQELVKRAGPLASAFGWLRGAAGGLSKAVPMALQGEAALGATMGALGGATAWGVNRAITSEDQKIRELEIQRDTYRRLTAEVQDELARRRMKPTPENTAAAVDYLT